MVLSGPKQFGCNVSVAYGTVVNETDTQWEVCHKYVPNTPGLQLKLSRGTQRHREKGSHLTYFNLEVPVRHGDGLRNGA